MRKRDPEFVEDVEELLEKSVLEEATSIVWKTFEEAMAKLDPESRSLLEEYFGGKDVQALSESHQLSTNELKTWLEQVKREVSENLRREFTVKQ